MKKHLILLLALVVLTVLSGCVPDSEIIDQSFTFSYNVKAENLQGINEIYLQEDEGMIWFTTETQGFLSYNLASKKWDYYDLKKGMLSLNLFSFAVGSGEVWIGTDLGAMLSLIHI